MATSRLYIYKCFKIIENKFNNKLKTMQITRWCCTKRKIRFRYNLEIKYFYLAEIEYFVP